MEPFSLLKFFQGFNPLKGKNWGKWGYYFILIAIALTIYHKVFEPKQITNTVIEKQTQIINQCPEENKAAGIRLNLWKLKLSFGL